MNCSYKYHKPYLLNYWSYVHQLNYPGGPTLYPSLFPAMSLSSGNPNYRGTDQRSGRMREVQWSTTEEGQGTFASGKEMYEQQRGYDCGIHLTFFIWYQQPVCMSTCWNRSILGTYFRTNLCGHVGKQKTINYTVVTRGIGKYLFKRTVMCQIVSRFHQQVKVEWCHTIYSRVFTTQPEERSRYSHIGCDNLDFHDVQS